MAPVASEESFGETVSSYQRGSQISEKRFTFKPTAIYISSVYVSTGPTLMTVKSFTFNPFETNCFVVSSAGQTVIIDPSCQSSTEFEVVTNYLKELDTQVVRILLTHAHIDHIFGCAFLSEYCEVGIEVHASEAILLERGEFQAQMFGVELVPPPEPVRFIEPGEQISFGDVTWNVLHTPGHSPGSLAFVDMANKVVFSGDVLFSGSIGRTDLWQGSLPVLMESIFQQLIPLGDDFRVLSGHGPETTIGHEREFNPFLVGHVPI